jgi:hypothetical protein
MHVKAKASREVSVKYQVKGGGSDLGSSQTVDVTEAWGSFISTFQAPTESSVVAKVQMMFGGIPAQTVLDIDVVDLTVMCQASPTEAPTSVETITPTSSLVDMPTASPTPSMCGESVVLSPDFTGAAASVWAVESRQSGSANVSFGFFGEDGSAGVQMIVVDGGAAASHLKLIQRDIVLAPGVWYQMQVKAKASREVSVKYQVKGGGSDLGSTQTVDVTETWGSFISMFQAPTESTVVAKVQMLFGGIPAQTVLDINVIDISVSCQSPPVIELSPPPAHESPSPSPSAPICNGSILQSPDLGSPAQQFWSFDVHSSTEATSTWGEFGEGSEGAGIRVSVASGGGVWYFVTLSQSNITLLPNVQYQLRVKAKSSMEMTRTRIQLKDRGDNVIARERVDLTSQWTEFTSVFQVTQKVNDVRIIYQLGQLSAQSFVDIDMIDVVTICPTRQIPARVPSKGNRKRLL